jgi:hypothetical protein
MARGLVAHLMVGTVEELLAGRGQLAVSAAQAREMLGISETYLRELVARGFLSPVAKHGKGFVYLAVDVQRLAQARR